MTSTPEPSAGQTPPPPTFSEAADHDGHHLRAGIVGLIVVVALAIAAGVTSAIVFSHRQSPQTPPPPAPGGQLVQPAANSAAAPPTSQPPAGAQTPHMSVTEPAAPVGNQKSLTGTAEAVDIEGASVTPANGWTVGSQGNNAVIIDKDDGTASILFLAGKVNSTDVEEALNGDISNVIDKLSMSNVKVTKTETGKVNSQNFQEVAKRGFMGDIATQQGTSSVVGM
ncbi:MAG TPA: hypothetical protein VH496_07780, partial [Mycobacterium sp.]